MSQSVDISQDSIDDVDGRDVDGQTGDEPSTALDDELGIQPARFLMFIGVLVAMTVLGGWQLLLVVAILVAFIVIHEAGHYLTARWSGMLATEFFIGFGPRIFSWRRGETTYGLKALPLGAYVRIVGMNNLDEVPPHEEPRAYRNASWHKRFLTVAAGPATHFVGAIVLAGFALWIFGQEVEGRWDVERVVEFSAAAEAGLERDDEILSIDGLSTTEFDDLASVVERVRGEVVALEVLRDGAVLEVDARIGERLTVAGARGYSGLYEGDLVVGFDGQAVSNYAEFATLASQRIGEQVEVDVVYGTELHDETITINNVPTNGAVVGFLGVARGAVRERLPVGQAVSEAGPTVWNGTSQLASRFGTLFTSAEGLRGLFAIPTGPSDPTGSPLDATGDQIRPLPELDENRLMSIVGAVGIGRQLVDEGAAAILVFFVGLNISLGMINLLPLLPFDGGHMVVATYEKVRSLLTGKRHSVDAAKLIPLTYAIVSVMMLIGGIAIVRDIVDPIRL